MAKTTIKRKKSQTTKRTGGSIRASISFPFEVYKGLEEIARQQKVSVAWIVRQATEQYVKEHWPLLFSTL